MHDTRLESQKFDPPGLQLAYGTAYGAIMRPWIVATARLLRSSTWRRHVSTPRHLRIAGITEDEH